MNGCPDCDRPGKATYRCSGCDDRFVIPGRWRYFPVANGHWHVPDEEVAWQSELTHHLLHCRDDAPVIEPVDRMPI